MYNGDLKRFFTKNNKVVKNDFVRYSQATKINANEISYKFGRFNEGNTEIKKDDNYTDLFIHGGTLSIMDLEALHNLRTLCISESVEIKQTNVLTKININYTEQSLPFTTTDKIHLIGFTSEAIPLFSAH